MHYWEDDTWKLIEKWCTEVLEAYQEGKDKPELFDWDSCQGCQYFGFNAKKFNIFDGKARVV